MESSQKEFYKARNNEEEFMKTVGNMSSDRVGVFGGGEF